MDFFSQNLRAKHTERAKSSGSPCVAAGLRGDGPAREHLATDVEAAHRGTRRRLTQSIIMFSLTRRAIHIRRASSDLGSGKAKPTRYTGLDSIVLYFELSVLC